MKQFKQFSVNNNQAKAVSEFMLNNMDVNVYRELDLVQVFGEVSKILEFACMLDRNR